MHTVGHCAVWLVLLDPERSIHHAKAPAPQEGPGRCELDHREPPRSRTFQLAPWGRLGPQPVSGERGTESALRVQTHRQSHPRLGADKDTISNFTRSFPLLWHVLPPLQSVFQAEWPVSSLSPRSCTWACIPMSTSSRSRWRKPWRSSGSSWRRSPAPSRGGTTERGCLTTTCPPTKSQTVSLSEGEVTPRYILQVQLILLWEKFYNAYVLTKKVNLQKSTFVLNFFCHLFGRKLFKNVIAESSQLKSSHLQP